jgi:hypothetical protein
LNGANVLYGKDFEEKDERNHSLGVLVNTITGMMIYLMVLTGRVVYLTELACGI